MSRKRQLSLADAFSACRGCQTVPPSFHANEVRSIQSASLAPCPTTPSKKQRNVRSRCAEDGCTSITPKFNLPTKTKGLYCKQHKKEGMVNVKYKRCAEDGCTSISPKFNLPTKTKGIYCGQHKKEAMVDVKNKRCAEDGCISQPSFNLPTESKGLYCGQHKKEGMFDVKNKRCAEDGCTSISPKFNLPTETKGLYCGQHKKEGMFDVISKRCAEDGCISQPSFNLPTESKGLYCGQHKKEGMFDVISKRCTEDGCISQPSFNLPTESKGLYCGQHKKDGMVDVVHKRCAEDGCTSITPKFNLPTKTKGLYCGQHKKEGMVDVKNKRCAEDGCISQPSFNLPTESKGLYCGQHKKEGMVDVKNKRCAEDGCTSISPKFNLLTETKGLYCGSHRQPGMGNVTKKNCAECKRDAVFGQTGKRAQFCSEHRKPGMVNVVLENKCSVLDCECEFDVFVHHEKFCLKHCPNERCVIAMKRLCKYCDIRENSNHVCKDCTKISCKKEWAIVRYLRTAIDTKFEYNSSRMLQGCSKKRPDIYFELPTHCVVVEIDEHQHRTYEETCECARINEIVNGIGGRSVVIIRFNPDATRAGGQTLSSRVSDRMDLLVATIKEQLTMEHHTFAVNLIQLYFDDPLAIASLYEPRREEDITRLVCI